MICKAPLHLLVILLILFSCADEKSNTKSDRSKDHEIMVADTIVYDVIIHNLDKEDVWKEESVKNLKRDVLVDYYFNAIYNGNLIAYDFFTEEVLEKQKLREYEQSLEFDRNKVGKIQFYEQWYLDTITNQMRKHVTEMVFGYHKIDTDSQLVGYKPIFSIKPGE